MSVCRRDGWLGDEDVRAHLAVVDHGAEAVQRVAEPLQRAPQAEHVRRQTVERKVFCGQHLNMGAFEPTKTNSVSL